MAIEGDKELLREIERIERLLRVTMDPPTLRVLTARVEELQEKLRLTEEGNSRQG